MLIDTIVTIACKCSSCGAFEFFNISLFKLFTKKEHNFACRCGKSDVCISKENTTNFCIKIGCIGCGNVHTFIINRKDLINKDISVFICPETGIQQCFLGRDEEVRKKVDSLEKEFDELMDTFGYESYFKNTQVMFDSLNKIHDIAEQGNLHCECAKSDIELVLLPDKIFLKCKKCEGFKIVNAASNEDLKDILSRQQILLFDDLTEYGVSESITFLQKYDGK